MEVILKQDMPGLGYKYDTVKVKPGYGRNYLIPQGLATLATPSAKKVLAENPVTGERTQVDYAIDSRARWIEETGKQADKYSRHQQPR